MTMSQKVGLNKSGTVLQLKEGLVKYYMTYATTEQILGACDVCITEVSSHNGENSKEYKEGKKSHAEAAPGQKVADEVPPHKPPCQDEDARILEALFV